MMEKISVIVPVYMSELYLEKCLDSIVQQTYQNLEIILINDGSTDGSAAICQRYQNQDARVKVYHKRNGGVSSSRNRALEVVTGDYIVFVDNDDWLELDHIQNLYDLLKKQMQILQSETLLNFWMIKLVFDSCRSGVISRRLIRHLNGFIINMTVSIISVNALQFRGRSYTRRSCLKILYIQQIKSVEDDYTTYKSLSQTDKNCFYE